ncbi:biotin-dependent carboxyltransferase family protein [Nocardia sp. NBC_00508]|uniref:5-oxoprolinase subunit C family protein n=1 Tax=Nocardia sp. NBC_00508 TaxID=2975992 RepID=UPI002E80B518|nr:biotin-dependent carboxyltransferase family protein [Nocardia sp. NBC_00508]WUD65864.1 biotin-dependent carboxyltransferase family protein [Nocardia sp. NBC_00508]
MAIEVMVGGLASTVQDCGRFGYYHVGIPPSGALDDVSLALANRLVGNPPDSAGIEAVYLGPTLHFESAGAVAVTGAPTELRLNGEEAPMWECLTVQPGDVLALGKIKHGARAYIVPAGGIDVPVLLGSRSTYGLGGLGGLDGRVLRDGDRLPLGASGAVVPGAALRERLWPTFATELELRVVMGLYDHLLTPEARETFLREAWTLTPLSDRVGLRYRGSGLPFVTREQPFGAGQDPSNIVDAGYPVGSIQIPGGVEPIILHRDAVTGGGYATVATVISADLSRLGQARPGSTARFVALSPQDALQARIERRRWLAQACDEIAVQARKR